MQHVTDELTLRVLLANDPKLAVAIENSFIGKVVTLVYHSSCACSDSGQLRPVIRDVFSYAVLSNGVRRKVLVGHHPAAICSACGGHI